MAESALPENEILLSAKVAESMRFSLMMLKRYRVVLLAVGEEEVPSMVKEFLLQLKTSRERARRVSDLKMIENECFIVLSGKIFTIAKIR